MRILIVESNPALGLDWLRELRTRGYEVELFACPEQALALLTAGPPDLVVLDLAMDSGSALGLMAMLAIRLPETPVIYVAGNGFFADGSIFGHCGNAIALLPGTVEARDLGILIDWHLRQQAAGAGADPAPQGKGGPALQGNQTPSAPSADAARDLAGGTAEAAKAPAATKAKAAGGASGESAVQKHEGRRMTATAF